MMKNKILLRILVVVVLYMVGCDLSAVKDRPTVAEYVIVRTNKTSYDDIDSFNNMKVTVTNNLNIPIYLTYYPFVTRQLKKDGEWKVSHTILFGALPYIAHVIYPKESKELEAHPGLPIYAGDKADLIGGTFRFVQIIYLGCEGAGESCDSRDCIGKMKVYSNEFIINANVPDE